MEDLLVLPHTPVTISFWLEWGVDGEDFESDRILDGSVDLNFHD